MNQQGQFRAMGVVLYRKDISASLRTLYLWCRLYGPFWVFAPGSGKGKLGRGMTEPLTWGEFHLYRSTKGFYLKAADSRDDFWWLRKNPKKLREALYWGGLLRKYLLPEHGEDKLLKLFYWSLVLLREGEYLLPLRWRFLWKWLGLRGEAPDLWCCQGCGRISEEGNLAFSPQGTGLLCSSCLPGTVEVSKEDIHVLHELRKAVMLSRKNFHNGGFTLLPSRWEKYTALLEAILRDNS